jgi:hypothetical protein
VLGVSGVRRTLVLIAVLAIHLIFVAALIEAFRQRKLSYAPQDIVSTLIYLPATTPATPPARHRAVRRPPAKSAAPTEPTSLVPPQVASGPAQTEAPIDWGANAHRAARDVLAAESIDRRRSRQMGADWLLARQRRHQREAPQQPFPWSHQPLTSWFDIDPDSFVIIFRLGRRCQIVFLVVAQFGCVVGHLDPEPGRSDLFDPKYRPRPLELPEPAVPPDLPEPTISESASIR